MIKNYFQTAWRTMIKNRTYAVINILGLTIGLTAAILVFTVVIDELSYDKFWTRAEDLYKVYQDKNMGDGFHQKSPYSPAELGKVLKDNFPEVVQFSRISTVEQRFRMSQENPDGIAVQVLNADTNVLDMLNFESVNGQLPSFVAGQTNLLITERFRDAYFNGQNPIGQVIEDVPTWNNEKQTFLITGVIKNIPENTHLRAEAIALNKPTSASLNKDGSFMHSRVYYLLEPGTDSHAFTKKMNDWLQNYIENSKQLQQAYGLQPITDVYLDSDYDSAITRGNRSIIYVLASVGALLLLIACINFINLCTSRAMKRLKETGVRKILGAHRSQLIGQFLTESLLFFLISTLLSITLYALALPVVESFMGHKLAHSLLIDYRVLCITLLLIFGASLVTGVYPAWILSGFKPSNTLRGRFFQSNLISVGGLQKVLVVVQFTIAIAVLVALLVVRDQVNYLTNKPIGYDKENLLHISSRNWEGRGEIFKTELKRLPGIEAASIASWNPVDGNTIFSRPSFDNPVKAGQKIEIHFIVADFDFTHTLGFKLQQGRYLDAAYGTDVFDMMASYEMDSLERRQYIDSRSALITASAAKQLGIREMGVTIPNLGYTPVGILQDFHRESLHRALDPVFIFAEKNPDDTGMFIRTTPGMEQQARQSLAKLWREFYPDRLLDAQWVTDILDKQYEAEQKQQTLFSFFSGLMLFLSAMGVLGLIMHAAQQRVKEISIRKVLGASVSSIVALLSKYFIRLVFIAVILATPIAWWAMNTWLADFAYRIAIEWWMFALAALFALVVVLVIVSSQAILAAVANPVDSLKDE